MKRYTADVDMSTASHKSQSFGSLKPGARAAATATAAISTQNSNNIYHQNKENSISKIPSTNASMVAAKPPPKGILKQSKISKVHFNSINPGTISRDASPAVRHQQLQPSAFYSAQQQLQQQQLQFNQFHSNSNNAAAVQVVSAAESILAQFESQRIAQHRVQSINMQPQYQHLSIYNPAGAAAQSRVQDSNFRSNQGISQYLNNIESRLLKPVGNEQRQMRISEALSRHHAHSSSSRNSSSSDSSCTLSSSSGSSESEDSSVERRRRRKSRRRHRKEKESRQAKNNKQQREDGSSSPDQRPQRVKPSLQNKHNQHSPAVKSKRETVFLTEQIFCIVCEDYIEVSKVNEHSRYCQEQGSGKKSGVNLQQSKMSSSQFKKSSHNQLSETQHKMEKVNQKLMKVKILMEEVHLRTDLHNYQRIDQYLSYTVRSALKICSTSNVTELLQLQEDLRILVKKFAEIQSAKNQHVVLSLLALSDKLAEFTAQKLEVVAILQKDRQTSEYVEFNEHDGFSSDESQSIPSTRRVEKQAYTTPTAAVDFNNHVKPGQPRK